METRLLQLFVPQGPAGEDGDPIYPVVIPRGALIIARRALRDGWRPVVFDAYSFPKRLRAFLSQITEQSLIAISIHGAPSVKPARELIDAIRAGRPEARVIVGGNLANVASSLLQAVFHDCLIYEGGTDKANDALREASGGRSEGIFHVPTPDETWELPDLDALEVPFERYLDDANFEYQLPTQVGCPFRCFHCGTGRSGLIAKVIRRPIDSLEAEVEYLVSRCRRLGVRLPRFWVTDETFTSSPPHTRAVLDVFLSRPGISWRAQTRVDSVDGELLRDMRAAGCHTVAFGVEVPTQAGMSLFGKREAMERVEYAFRSAREAGLRSQAILVFGAPEDQSSYDDVFDTLAELEPDSLQSYLYHPVPGSPWWRKYGKVVDLATPEQWTKLDFHSPLVTSDGKDGQAIGRFLSALVWSPESPTAEVRGWRDRLITGSVCPRCDSNIRASVLNLHRNVEVLRFELLDGSEILVASGPRDIVAYPSANLGNLHQAVFWITDLSVVEALTRLCPRCGILPEFSTSEIEEVSTYAEGHAVSTAE